jgi:hypothetical protein
MSLFHQRQQGNYCRFHSINNLVGRQICTTVEFDKYCDEFDKQNKFEVNYSKNSQEFYNNGEENNIFGYTMKKKGINTRMEGYDRHRKHDIKIDTEDLLGAFILSPGHVWCIRYIDGKWFLIDSLNSSEPEVQMNYFQNKNLAFLFVWRELNIMDKLSSLSVESYV